MISIWESITETNNYLFDELSSPLTKTWLLVSSPYPLFGILFAYNIFCTIIGPWWMKNRKPYNVKNAILLYNVFQVIISAYITYEGYVYVFSGNFDFNCQGVRVGEERIARGIQVYFMTKIVELLDTIFFVLRKSDRQITFLHLYHHTLMPFISWIGLKYFPGGQGVLIGAINSLIHVFMYVYYLLSSLGPRYQKYLWWKQYLTLMQIAQFTIILAHSFHSLFIICSYPTILKILTILESVTFIYMFSDFYYRVYIARKPINGKHVSSNGGTETKKKSFSNGNGLSNGNLVHEDSETEATIDEVEKKIMSNGKSLIKNHSNGHAQGGKRKSKNV